MIHSVPRTAPAFVLAHLSDPHLTGLDAIRWPQLANKRLIGYLSWQRRRRHLHPPEQLALLVQDLSRQAPDHIVVTGDLTQLGTPAECREALAWLRELGGPERVTVVPGNHDTYVQAPWSDTVGLWRDYMDGGPESDFPFLRRRGPLALIGACSALPTGAALATGRLGASQLARLERLLSDCDDAFRVLLIHHPLQPGAVSWRKRLIDAPQLRRMLARCGAELVLHGHAHRRREDWLPVPAGHAPVIGAPSASAAFPEESTAAAYNLFVVERRPAEWAVTLRRRLIRADGSVSACPPVVLSGPAVEPAK